MRVHNAERSTACNMQVASASHDKLLELQICVGLGSFFTQLRDLTKAIVFLQNALALLKSITLADVQTKYRSLILFYLSVALRKSGSLLDARSAGEVRAESRMTSN